MSVSTRLILRFVTGGALVIRLATVTLIPYHYLIALATLLVAIELTGDYCTGVSVKALGLRLLGLPLLIRVYCTLILLFFIVIVELILNI